MPVMIVIIDRIVQGYSRYRYFGFLCGAPCFAFAIAEFFILLCFISQCIILLLFAFVLSSYHLN